MSGGIESVLNAIEKEENGQNAVEILKIASYFKSSPIEIGTFSTLIEDAQKLKSALKLLEKHSLMDTCYDIKNIMVKENAREKIRSFLSEKNEEKSVLKKALKLLSESPVFGYMIPGVISVIIFAKKYPELIEEHRLLPVSILKRLKSYYDALMLGSEAFDVWKESLGEFHRYTLSLQFVLTGILVTCKEYDRALELSTELYEKEFKLKGMRDITPTLKRIADLRLSKMKPESESELRNLVFGKVTVSETKNNSVLTLWEKYASLLMEHDFADEALKILRQILKRRYQLLSPDDEDIDEVKHSMAAAYFGINKFNKGLDLLESLYDRRKSRFGELSMKTLGVRYMMAQGYDALEMHERALIVFEDVAEKLRQVMGKYSSLYISTLTKMSGITFTLGRHEKSYEINAELYELLKDNNMEDDDMTCLVLKKNMIASLRAQGKDSEAEELRNEVFEECFKNSGSMNFDKALRFAMLESINPDISFMHGEFE